MGPLWALVGLNLIIGVTSTVRIVWDIRDWRRERGVK